MKGLFKLPKVRISNMASDYACASFEKKIDFSCNPYGSQGDIDASSSGDTAEKIGIIDTIIGWFIKIFG